MPNPTDIKPPFTHKSAIQKVQAAEDGWNTRDPEQVSWAYSINSEWRKRGSFVKGRQQIISFLTGKWEKELEYRLAKQLWAFTENRIAVRFQYEYHDASGNWFRAYGNENWEFDDDGLMRRREASINDYAIKESERKFHWPLGPRPASVRGLEEHIK